MRLMKYLDRHDVITVDIFDTLLLRRKWPEDVQFMEVSKIWAQIFEEYFSKSFSYYEIYTYRQEIRKVLQTAKKLSIEQESTYDKATVGIVEWFESVALAIASTCKHRMSRDDLDVLVGKMVQAELKNEKSNLTPNKNLIKKIRSAQLNKSSLKIYYLSDMYLRSRDIDELLKSFSIDDLFDGGYTSSDIKKAKWSGRLYEHIKDKLGTKNILHIGDNRKSDYLMAKRAGFTAIHYRKVGNYHLRPVISLGWSGVLYWKRHAYRRQIRGSMLKNTKNASLETSLATYFSSPLIYYVSQLYWMSLLHNYTVLAVSSEAQIFKLALSKLYGNEVKDIDIRFEKYINRKSALLALAKIHIDNNDVQMLQELLLGEMGMVNNQNIHDFLFESCIEKHPKLNGMLDEQFFKLVSKHSNSESGADLRAAANVVYDVLKGMNAKSVIIMDVGWNGTVQAFLQKIADLKKIEVTFHGVYMGFRGASRRKELIHGKTMGLIMSDIGCYPYSELFVPDIWEYIYTGKRYGRSEKNVMNQHISNAINQYIDTVSCSPEEYYVATNRYFRRTLTSPSLQDVNFFGSIKIDSTFDSHSKISLIQRGLSKKILLQETLFRPRKMYRHMSKSYAWPHGLFKYYGLLSFWKICNKILRIIY